MREPSSRSTHAGRKASRSASHPARSPRGRPRTWSMRSFIPERRLGARSAPIAISRVWKKNCRRRSGPRSRSRPGKKARANSSSAIRAPITWTIFCPDSAEGALTPDHLRQHPGPCAREIAEIVTAPAECHQPAPGGLPGEIDERPGRMRVGCGRQGEMAKRVASQAVGAGLQNEELGLVTLDMGEDALPGGEEILVTRARRHREIELRAFCFAGPGLSCRACSRIEKAPVFVDVREYQIRVGLVAVEHAVAVMNVDVDVGYALDP